MAKINHSKIVCPACKGNGYRKVQEDASRPDLMVVINCQACDNQGEIKNDKKTIHALRYLNYML